MVPPSLGDLRADHAPLRPGRGPDDLRRRSRGCLRSLFDTITTGRKVFTSDPSPPFSIRPAKLPGTPSASGRGTRAGRARRGAAGWSPGPRPARASLPSPSLRRLSSHRAGLQGRKPGEARRWRRPSKRRTPQPQGATWNPPPRPREAPLSQHRARAPAEAWPPAPAAALPRPLCALVNPFLRRSAGFTERPPRYPQTAQLPSLPVPLPAGAAELCPRRGVTPGLGLHLGKEVLLWGPGLHQGGVPPPSCCACGGR